MELLGQNGRLLGDGKTVGPSKPVHGRKLLASSESPPSGAPLTSSSLCPWHFPLLWRLAQTE